MKKNQQTFSFVSQKTGRIDKIIPECLTDYSRSFISQLITDQQIFVNNQAVNKNSLKIKPGDTILINIPLPQPLSISPQKGNLDIVYEDKNFLVINKPPFMPVHTSHGHQNDTLTNIILYHYPEFIHFGPINNIYRPGIVHRLDKDTSGLIVVAKNQPTLNFFQQEIKNHQWKKKYYALVVNNADKSRGVIIKNICRDPHHRQKFITTSLNKGKNAETHYRVVKNYSFHNHNLSLMDINLKTGRTHQIRVHLLSENLPILGDQTYFTKESKQISQLLDTDRQLLHAYLLQIKNPQSNLKQKFQIDLPPDFQKILSQIKK